MKCVLVLLNKDLALYHTNGVMAVGVEGTEILLKMYRSHKVKCKPIMAVMAQVWKRDSVKS